MLEIQGKWTIGMVNQGFAGLNVNLMKNSFLTVWKYKWKLKRLEFNPVQTISLLVPSGIHFFEIVILPYHSMKKSFGGYPVNPIARKSNQAICHLLCMYCQGWLINVHLPGLCRSQADVLLEICVYISLDVTYLEFTVTVYIHANLHLLYLFVNILFRYNIAYQIFYLLGCATLLPWNFFITANSVSRLHNFVLV